MNINKEISGFKLGIMLFHKGLQIRVTDVAVHVLREGSHIYTDV